MDAGRGLTPLQGRGDPPGGGDDLSAARTFRKSEVAGAVREEKIMTMRLDEIIDKAWEHHDKDPKGVAAELEQAAGLVDDAHRAIKYATVVNHVVGLEMGDWKRAQRLVRLAVEHAKPGPTLAPAYCYLAVACYMTGDVVNAMTAEMKAGALAPRDAMASILRVRALTAEALMNVKRRDECLAVFTALLDVAETLRKKTAADKTMAIAANNITSAMLEMDERTPSQNAILERGALAAREFWIKAGDWVNRERADYLCALVYNALGRFDEAAQAATRALSTILANGGEPVDTAFLHVALAGAYRGLGRSEAYARAIETAEKLGSALADEGIRDWLGRELAKVR